MNPSANLAFSWRVKDAGIQLNKLNYFMKLAIIAAAVATFAASCCPSAAPAPSKPAYVAPSK